MNTLTINLSTPVNTSSAEQRQTEVLSEILLYDKTTVSVSLTGIPEVLLPLYLEIDWGDGTTEFFENEIFKYYRKDNITLEVIQGKMSTILSRDYQHTYNPPNFALYKVITAKFSLRYSNNYVTVTDIPLKIRAGDYFETIGDMKLYNTEILSTPDNDKRHQFLTKNGGYLVELETGIK